MRKPVLIALMLVLQMVQSAAGPIGERLTALHLDCEKAYLVNDFSRMKETIDQRLLILSDKEVSRNGTYAHDSHLALLHKDMGSYSYCLADIDGGSYKDALGHYRKSLDIYRDILKDSHGAAVVRTELAQLHYRCAEYSEALQLLISNREHFRQTGLEQKELEAWSEIALCKARLGLFDSALKDIDSTIMLAGRFSVPLERIRRKGKILILRSEAEDVSPAEAVPLFQQYFNHQKDSITRNFRTMDAAQRERYWLRMQPFIADCFRLEDSAAELLYDAVLFSKGILMQFSGRTSDHVAPGWKDVQKRLKRGECAIEFIRYEKAGRQLMAALVLHHDGSPSFIRITDMEDFLNYRLPEGMTVDEAVNKEVAAYKNALYNCRELQDMVWPSGLRSVIKKAGRVYFAADGIFHKLAIEYMYPSSAAPELVRLTSVRELMKDRWEYDGKAMLICGGLDYYAKTGISAAQDNDALAYELLAGRRIRFRNLKGAKEEAEDIHSLRSCPADTILTGAEADEQSLEAIFNSYPAVSIATHGYFGGENGRKGTDLKTWNSDEKLSRSVLVVSGAQRNMDNGSFNPYQKDGLISAREISCMNLDKVRLFIMSACQSGLGEITPDGIFGLQRGLKNAGAGAMIVSLWEVDDKATRHFMVSFHKALQESGDIRKAFGQARAAMDETICMTVTGMDSSTMTEAESGTTVEITYNKPQYRNAFILIDNLQHYEN